MDTKQTFKLVGYHRLLSWLSFLVGMGFVALGVYLGLGETISILLANFPAEFDRATAAASPAITAVLSVLGLLVWQVGASLALTKTMERAIATEAEGTDEKQVKSEVLDVVNDQLSGVEQDLRSEIRDLERSVDDDGLSAGTSTGGGRSSRSASADAAAGAAGGSTTSSGRSTGDTGRSARQGRSSEGRRSEDAGRSGRSTAGEGAGRTRSEAAEPGDDDADETSTGGGSERRSRRHESAAEDDDEDDPLA